ncbi:MAG TPA: DUF2520 domain-containing protein [Puia sp.]|jgi:predicted short-subunit dehydrogenase-like oxidoreductase (DUF2520 family)
MKVVIIGSGNVATVMGSRIAAAGHTILQVVARREEPAARLAALLGCGYSLESQAIVREADLYIAAISDKALAGLAQVLQLPGRLVVHTAGAMSSDVLLNVSASSGVLYPLQSLRSDVRPFPEFPLLVAANRPEDLPVIEAFARTISDQVQQADDETRLKLHVAATMVNNFSNYLYTGASVFCAAEKLDFSLLLPLIRETAGRIAAYPPQDVQTGPAVRGDEGTIRRHLEILSNYQDLIELYRLFTIQIQEFYGIKENRAG